MLCGGGDPDTAREVREREKAECLAGLRNPRQFAARSLASGATMARVRAVLSERLETGPELAGLPRC
eukprot:11737124-Alexandrium_andersonii.AAC.1